MGEAGVEFANVSFAVGSGRSIVRDVSLRLEPGTTTALLGRSGSGKTTLLRMVNGLVKPTQGAVLVDARPTQSWDLLELRRRIGYVIQDAGLFPHWSVARNVGLALELSGRASGERVDEVMRLAGLDLALKDRYPRQLSGGQRQRAGVARALAADPEILLLDEPFGALDPITRAEMQEMVLGLLRKVRKTALLVTHDLNEALYLASRIVFLEGGLVTANLATEEVLRSENEHVRRYVAAVRR